MRDLSSDQLRLGEELDREAERRTLMERENRMSIQELSQSVRRTKHQDTDDKVGDRSFNDKLNKGN